MLRSLALFACLAFAACGSDNNGPPAGSEADLHGVGAACASNADCWEQGQSCLPLKGGYCGVAGCTADPDCPAGSRCVAHSDGTNYCFLVCANKVDCNFNRPVELESNCSSNITFTSGGKNGKACVPPS
jgi:hypothetical protein